MRIALIAHDKKKNEMIDFAVKYRDVLSEHELFATGTTGTLVMGETGLNIKRMKSGPLGGEFTHSPLPPLTERRLSESRSNGILFRFSALSYYHSSIITRKLQAISKNF